MSVCLSIILSARFHASLDSVSNIHHPSSISFSFLTLSSNFFLLSYFFLSFFSPLSLSLSLSYPPSDPPSSRPLFFRLFSPRFLFHLFFSFFSFFSTFIFCFLLMLCPFLSADANSNLRENQKLPTAITASMSSNFFPFYSSL